MPCRRRGWPAAPPAAAGRRAGPAGRCAGSARTPLSCRPHALCPRDPVLLKRARASALGGKAWWGDTGDLLSLASRPAFPPSLGRCKRAGRLGLLAALRKLVLELTLLGFVSLLVSASACRAPSQCAVSCRVAGVQRVRGLAGTVGRTLLGSVPLLAGRARGDGALMALLD